MRRVPPHLQPLGWPATAAAQVAVAGARLMTRPLQEPLLERQPPAMRAAVPVHAGQPCHHLPEAAVQVHAGHPGHRLPAGGPATEAGALVPAPAAATEAAAAAAEVRLRRAAHVPAASWWGSHSGGCC